jgi:hypothetical protein
MNKLYLTTLLTIITVTLSAQQIKLFDLQKNVAPNEIHNVSKGSILTVNENIQKQLMQRKAEKIVIDIPYQQEVFHVQLQKVNLFSKQFAIVKASDFSETTTVEGYFLQGNLLGIQEKTSVAFSIFEKEIIAVINDGKRTISIAKLNNSHNKYIVYNEADIIRKNNLFETDDIAYEPNSNTSITSNDVNNYRTGIGCTLDVYFEIANRAYITAGSTIANATNYLCAIFNNVQLIYANEQIDIQIREIKVWDIVDPEDALTTTNAVLNNFELRMGATGFNGDLAHYVTSKSIGGGLAYLNVLSSSSRYRTGVSGNLTTTNTAFPTYTWNAYVISHEIGHNIGSNHTQWCGWTGGAIDNCYAVEGSCSPGPTPTSGGTIMSYCHLSGIGVNFNNGFGPLPGNLLRSRITANAICNCNNLYVNINKTDAGCGGTNNGVAEAIIEDGTGPFTFEWSNGATTQQVTGLAPGSYYVKVTGTNANCTIIKGVRINNNTSSSLFVGKAPSNNTITECTGNNIVLSANAIGGNGAYTYQWYNGVSLISGETNSTYTATTSGNYLATVNSGTCTGSSAATNITFAPTPLPVISANKPSPICANDKITLSVSPHIGYNISWYKDGVLIVDSISKDITVNASGNYAARLTTLSNCQANSANFNLVVNPLPSATISGAAFNYFCDGVTQILTANTDFGTTYQWFKNGILIPSETNSTYTVTAVGGYSVIISDALSCSKQSATVYYEKAQKVNFDVTNTRPLTFCTGDSTVLKTNVMRTQGGTSVSGSEILNYIWYKDGTIITGAIKDSLVVKVSGIYSVKVGSNTRCDSTKLNIIVVVNPLPTTSILSSLGSPINYGDLTTLSTTAPYVTYQWYRNGAIIVGATNVTYDIGDGGIYTCEITDGNNCKGQSAPLVLQVLNNNPIITGQLNNNYNVITTTYTSDNTTTLLKSTNGIQFNEVATLQAPFVYNDNAINNLSTYYYKLKVTQNTGNVYSNVIVLNRGNQQQSIKIFPNPVHEYMYINSILPIEQYQIFDHLGKAVKTRSVNQSEASILKVSLRSLPKGSYVLRCNTKTGISNHVFLIQ